MECVRESCVVSLFHVLICCRYWKSTHQLSHWYHLLMSRGYPSTPQSSYPLLNLNLPPPPRLPLHPPPHVHLTHPQLLEIHQGDPHSLLHQDEQQTQNRRRKEKSKRKPTRKEWKKRKSLCLCRKSLQSLMVQVISSRIRWML